MVETEVILVATDFSDNSANAMDRGFLLANASGAPCTVLHAVSVDALASLREFLSLGASNLSEDIEKNAAAYLAKFVADSSVKGDASIRLLLERGAAAPTILSVVEREGSRLVLLGAHGGGLLQRMRLGSTASRLLRKTPRPVLIVKNEARAAYARVLIPVDFSPVSAECIRIAREVAPSADLVLLHTVFLPLEGKMQYANVAEQVIEQFRTDARARATRAIHLLAAAAGLSATEYSGLVMHGHAARNILDYEAQHACDLVVIGKHGSHFAEELFLGSVTKRVLEESKADVLVVVDERRPDLLRIAP
jgi:nucleotide-binding universal stress UspA family protein